MTKNIIVVDENGKKYGTTYLKRAKGLVKQGRARFLARNMLCLACPPEQNLEDNDMSEQTIENKMMENEIVGNGTVDEVPVKLRQMEPNGDGARTKAIALGDIVKCRETTNQQLLQFYGKMYDDLKEPGAVDVVSQKTRLQEQLLKIMDKTLENNGELSSDDISNMFNGAYDAIRHIND